MFQQALDPVAGSPTVSALVACLPLVTMFVTLGVLRWKAHYAGLTSVAVAILVAIVGFKMPVMLAVHSTLNGAAFGLYPIAWIVVTAIFMYMVTVKSGRFNDLRATFNLLSDDLRIQAILIAFCFGGLLEALAGYGAPIAITGAMLMALGFSPLRAALAVLLANTAPVAFGAVAIPVDTAAKVAEMEPRLVSQVAASQTFLLAIFVPLMLVLMVDGMRGVRQTLPVSLPIGIAFAVASYLTAQSAVYQLTNVFASLAGLLVAIVILRFWQPPEADRVAKQLAVELEEARASGMAAAVEEDETPDVSELTPGRIWMAVVPYVLVIIIFGSAKLVAPLKAVIDSTTLTFDWPGLAGQILRPDGSAYPVSFKLDLIANPGGQLLLTGILVALIYRVSVADTVKTFTETLYNMRFAILTMASVLALAFVMNASGQTMSIGNWIAGVGSAFAFVGPILGWLGVFVTGSDTSSNALFCALQKQAASQAGIDQLVMVAGNTAGGVVGKMISPQNLAIATTAVGLTGQESLLLRKVVWWSIALLAVTCVIIGLQAVGALGFIIPDHPYH